MLGMARALVTSGHRPRHRICFTSRTAEEYGITGSLFDWCIGAWGQVNTTHPQWSTESPFHLCVEATGHRSLRSVIEAPVELAAWARRVGRTAALAGWAPTGWRVAPPVAGTEQWPFLLAGIPLTMVFAARAGFWETRVMAGFGARSAAVPDAAPQQGCRHREQHGKQQFADACRVACHAVKNEWPDASPLANP